MFTIDIDTGGTFTDGFFTWEGEFKTAKVLTTPHDLTVCLAECIKEGAQQYGVPVKELLLKAEVIRYSSTIGVNTLITRTGSKIGLIVTKGHKKSLYAKEPKEIDPIFSFISNDMIEEVEEGIDNQGKVAQPLNEKEVSEKMQSLIDMGARAIAVSLKNSAFNPIHEKQIKRIIKEQYPSFYLGSVRVFLASEVSGRPGDFYRTNTVVINGYIHASLVKHLYKAEDDLRANLYPHPLMVSHSQGGVARVAKTRAIDTFSSGPALGLIGSGMLGKMYGFGNVLTVDIGGTSLDVGLIRDGSYPYALVPSISGLPVNVPMINTHSVPLASGSIASLDSSKNLRIGPRSAGARPGPACFDLGGMEATVTDADVVLGFIDPNYFLGGKVRLNKQRAISAIKTKIAEPLAVRVEEASYQIRETIDREIKSQIIASLKLQGIKDIAGLDIALMAYGGAGPTHCCGFARGLSFEEILISPFSAIFSAFGSSRTDLLHTYTKLARIFLVEDGKYLEDYDQFNRVVRESIEIAKRDIQGEGFSPGNAIYSLDLIGNGSLDGVKLTIDKPYIESEEDVERICGEFRKTNLAEDSQIALNSIGLNAIVHMPHFEMTREKVGSQDPSHAFKAERDIFWSPGTGYQKTPIYERNLLAPGNLIAGPAVIEAQDTTYVIPADFSFYIDEYSNGIIKEV